MGAEDLRFGFGEAAAVGCQAGDFGY